MNFGVLNGNENGGNNYSTRGDLNLLIYIQKLKKKPIYISCISVIRHVTYITCERESMYLRAYYNNNIFFPS